MVAERCRNATMRLSGRTAGRIASLAAYSTSTILSSVTLRQNHIVSWKMASPVNAGIELLLLLLF